MFLTLILEVSFIDGVCDTIFICVSDSPHHHIGLGSTYVRLKLMMCKIVQLRLSMSSKGIQL